MLVYHQSRPSGSFISYGTLSDKSEYFSLKRAMMKRNIMPIKAVAQAVFFVTTALLIGFFKCSFIVGSFSGFFSGINTVVPLAGCFGGGFGALGFGCLRALKFVFFGGGLSYALLANCVPGLFAGLYWSHNGLLTRVLIPLLCMVLFVVHPVGGQAFAYSLYWLIPVAFYVSGKNNLFFTALGSTFTAHAVGSVIWLYAMPMAPVVWYGLIPVVAIERVLFATSIVAMHNVISMAFRYISKSLKIRILAPIN